MKVQPRITGVYAFRPLEIAAWLMLAIVFCTAVVARHVIAAPVAEGSKTAWRMDLNSASYDELLTLPGMYARKAHALIAAREKRGGFQTMDDVANIPGITRGFMKRVETLVEVRAAP